MRNPLTENAVRTISARWILPVAGEPIHGGWIRLQGQRIVEIESGRPPGGAVELGDVVLFPGLVNAHTHLEFSDCDHPIGEPGIPLANWIGQVIAARGKTDRAAKRHAIEKGLAESLASGGRLIGEITTTPCEYPQSEIDIVGFAEVLGLSEERWSERIDEANQFVQSISQAGWSPHAPYSTSIDALQVCIRRANELKMPLAMHLAESPDERELLSSGSGRFAAALKSIGVWRDDLFPWISGHESIGQVIQWLAAAPRALMIHCNDFRANEIAETAKHDNLSVVYCPRTHAFFGYDQHPVAEMLDAGIRVAIGTDSRASNPDLSVWNEIQWLCEHRQDLAPETILRMGTLNGADALGFGSHGRLAVGCTPGINWFQSNANNLNSLYDDMATAAIHTMN